jgi:hypothetical protein
MAVRVQPDPIGPFRTVVGRAAGRVTRPPLNWVNEVDFYAENTPLVFGVPIERVSLAYLVERGDMREALIEADTCIGMGSIRVG